ncbi:SCO6880 family protein [Kitasatospora purpeofusca]|uniref:SCO6880 family protein n=1 Tax=Kitasatospora purpeofusca TaxID=67352 RepID=UPI002B1D2D6D|nr:SCO6880 family protein [Kitasatospora purpeofusca]
MTPSETPATIKFPSRSRRGILLGLTPSQLVATAFGGALLLTALMTVGILGALALTPLWVLLAVAVVFRIRGRSLAEWAPIGLRYWLRRTCGQLIWLARPSTRPTVEGLLHLPGTAASLRAVTSPDGRLGAVHDQQQGTLTAVTRVSSRAFALLDPATQSDNVRGWGRALAALSRSGQIARIQVLERTVPDSGDALQRYWLEHGLPNTPVAGPIYADLLAAAGPAAAPHEAYIAIALDLREARRLINQAGGGLAGAFAVLAQLTASLDQSVRGAGLVPGGWLTAGEIAAVVRTAYDPAVLGALERWSDSGRPEADVAAAGPVVLVEEPEKVRTDSAHHAVFWIEQWPRTETSAGFLHQLLYSSGVRRTLSLQYAPQQIDAALRDVQRKKATIVADAAERVRRGQVDSEADTVEYADVKARELQLIAGHADVAMTGLLVVSADDAEQLSAACAQVETAAVAALIDLRRLTLQQAEAFTAAALPLARL